MADVKLGDAVIAKLAVHLGPNVARMSVDRFMKKKGLPQLTAADLPALIAELKPMLNVMIGKGPSDSVVAEIERAAK